MTKVVHVTTVDMTLRYLLLNQLRNLQDAGYEVVALSSPGPDVPILAAAGIRHLPVPMTRRACTPLADLKTLWRLYRMLRRERPVIVHTHTPKAGILGRCAARLLRVPLVIHTHHGFTFLESPWVWRVFFGTLERMAARWSDLIFSLNREDSQMAVREGIWDHHQVAVFAGGLGIDLSRLNPACFSPADIQQQRCELGLDADSRVVGFVGRLVRDKGLLELLSAARLVRDRLPNVRLVIIGATDMHKPDALTSDCAARYGISDICRFLGWRQDMPGLYAAMDVLVLPSHREGFGMVLAEAAAMGVPVIATDIRGCREAVENGRNGLLAPRGNVEALADAICQILTDRDMARRMGEAGRRLALERFDERMVFDQVKREYARLLVAKGLPVPTPCPRAESGRV